MPETNGTPEQLKELVAKANALAAEFDALGLDTAAYNLRRAAIQVERAQRSAIREAKRASGASMPGRKPADKAK